ncbi:polyketide synthase [Hypoxylon sp. FL1857]|nr:polyketide synthase [Hypoxylon sp. FL1857]
MAQYPFPNGVHAAPLPHGNNIHQGKAQNASPSEPIAIVGISSRFAGGASTPSKLWELCASGKGGWSPIPADRFDARSFYHPEKGRKGRNYALGGYFLEDDVALFDAAFFNLSADVASAMDPQIRLLLESVHEAVEDAGIPLDKLAGSNTSVFSGCYGKDYHELQARDPESLPAAFLTGNGTAMLSNRISYFYDLYGPSMSIDTGCSSGLVALHQGCRSIRTGESDMAIIGASSLMLSPDLFIAKSSLSMTGADGKCYAWDARAQGYGRGEGVATLIIKPLHTAIRDGDRIHALVRETGLNQDGKTASITSPSVHAQTRLIEQCYKRAGLKLSETGYVEAHMTGTQVGDIAEAEALAKTFGKSRKCHDPVLVGSVKTNVGHCEPVSGLAGIIKAIWAMKNRQIPPNLNYETPNPNIPLEEWNLKVPTVLTPWPRDKPLRASINNFGYGGTNAHVILEGVPEVGGRPNGVNGISGGSSLTHRIYVVSAKDSAALKNRVTSLATYVRSSLSDDRLGDLAYTLSERRSRLPAVAAVRAENVGELANRLDQISANVSHATGKRPRLGFVFNGQGAQWHAMGRELKAYPIFDLAIKKADETLKGYGATWSLLEELLRNADSTRVSEVNLSQPMTVALQLCLVDLLGSWGIIPSAVTSHSSGEIAAAYAVGALSFEEALGVAYYRGELALRNSDLSALSGSMMAAGVGAGEAAKYIASASSGRAVVACINSPGSVTLSGDLHAIDEIAASLRSDGIFTRKLKVPLAYHSHHMQCIAKDYLESLRDILPLKRSMRSMQVDTNIRFASPVTGEIVSSPADFTPDHWVRNLTSPVLFNQAFENMCFGENGTAEVDMIVEVGAHSTLSGPIRQILKGREISYVSCLQRSVDAVETMQSLACDLLTRGYPVSISGVNFPTGGCHTFLHDLPTYSWNHKRRYWTESRISREIRQGRFAPHELLGSLLPGGGPAPTWRNLLRSADVPWLEDYRVDSNISLPPAGYICMAVEAVRLLTESHGTVHGFRLQNIEFGADLIIPCAAEGVKTQFAMRPLGDGSYEFSLSSLRTETEWIENCKGYVAAEHNKIPKSDLRLDSFASSGLNPTKVDVNTFYTRLSELGTYQGKTFRNVTDIETSGNRILTEVTIGETYDYLVHPTTLESIIQGTMSGLAQKARHDCTISAQSMGTIFIGRELHRRRGDKLRALAEILKSDRRHLDSDVVVVNHGEDATPVLQIKHFYAQATTHTSGNGQYSNRAPIRSRMDWELDIWSRVPTAFQESIQITLGDQDRDFEKKILRLSYNFIHDAVRELESDSQKIESWKWHFKAMYNWMKQVVVLGASGALAPRSRTWANASRAAKQMLADEMNTNGGATGQLIVRVGQQLPGILRGEVTPLELMMEGDLLNKYYMDYPKLQDRTYKHLAKVAELLAVKRPGANVLEIGAGTGGATKTVLEAFGARAGDDSRSVLGHYTFTDVSSGFFEAAKKKLAPWVDLMDFKPLNIESDPLQQSFTPGSYDIIVSSLCLHATKSLHRTMINVRKLLKPGGKLVLIETTQDRLDMQIIFGTFEGWWLAEEEDRKTSPNASLKTWDKVLRETGFTGIDFEIGDCEDSEYQCTSLILSSAPTRPAFPTSISLVHAGIYPPQPWLGELSEEINKAAGIMPVVENLYDVQTWDDKLVIFMAEMGGPFVHGMGQAAFDRLRNLLINSRGLLWLSCGGTIDAEQLFHAETQGLLRVLRQEDPSKRCVHLDFSPGPDENPWTSGKVMHIIDVIQQNFDYNDKSSNLDSEYAVKDSARYVPRFYPVFGIPEISDPLPLSQNATYLISGGMGRIGSAIASWLIGEGAKNLLVVSRNAETHPKAAELDTIAKAADCSLHIRSCDIADEKELVKLLAECSDIMPPIQGVINASMVLDDTILERMTWPQWQRVIKAKVDSSFNLHMHLPALNFFIMLSSVAGLIGHTSEANYAAGNTFQDALARHRTASGQAAVALDLPIIKGVGWIPELGDREEGALSHIENLGSVSMPLDRLLDLLEEAIHNPQRPNPSDSQVILGLARYDAIPDGSSTKRDPRFGTLRLAAQGSVTDQTAATVAEAGVKDSMAELIHAAAGKATITLPEATRLIVDAVAEKTAAIFNIERGEIDASVPLTRYGVDSLVGVDLRNWLVSSINAKVSVSDILQSPSLSEFGELVATKSELIAGITA